MAPSCWEVVRGAAAGREEDRSAFARLYTPVIRAYLRARWRGSPLVQEVDDAVQEFFVDCFKQDGVLDTVDVERPSAFHGFLYAVARNVARHVETRRGRRRERQPTSSVDLERFEADEERLSQAFDRAWALALVREAVSLQARRTNDDASRLRVELLRLRFQDDLPIRDIAAKWDEDPARLHHEYARARKEFETALLDVIRFHQPESGRPAPEEARRILQLLF